MASHRQHRVARGGGPGGGLAGCGTLWAVGEGRAHLPRWVHHGLERNAASDLDDVPDHDLPYSDHTASHPGSLAPATLGEIVWLYGLRRGIEEGYEPVKHVLGRGTSPQRPSYPTAMATGVPLPSAGSISRAPLRQEPQRRSRSPLQGGSRGEKDQRTERAVAGLPAAGLTGLAGALDYTAAVQLSNVVRLAGWPHLAAMGNRVEVGWDVVGLDVCPKSRRCIAMQENRFTAEERMKDYPDFVEVDFSGSQILGCKHCGGVMCVQQSDPGGGENVVYRRPQAVLWMRAWAVSARRRSEVQDGKRASSGASQASRVFIV